MNKFKKWVIYDIQIIWYVIYNKVFVAQKRSKNVNIFKQCENAAYSMASKFENKTLEMLLDLWSDSIGEYLCENSTFTYICRIQVQ